MDRGDGMRVLQGARQKELNTVATIAGHEVQGLAEFDAGFAARLEWPT